MAVVNGPIMPGMNLRRLVSGLLVAAGLTLALILGAAAALGDKGVIVAVLAVGMLAGTCVVIWSPRWIYGTLAFVLGAAPVAVIPGIGLPFVFVFAVLTWAAIITHRIPCKRVLALEACAALLVAASLISMIAAAHSSKDFTMFLTWALATSLIFALLRLDRADMRMFGRVFAIGTFFGALFGLVMYLFDKTGNMLNYLAIFGYGVTGSIGTHLRFFSVNGQQSVRLTGTYIDPNAAGILLFVGLTLAIALFSGAPRIGLVVVIGAALVLTMSRSNLGSLVVALVLFVLFQKMRPISRTLLVLGTMATGLVMMGVPAVQSRLLNSFASGDKGSADRSEALHLFPGYMQGHWFAGRGWAAPEFTDEVLGYKINYVANAPLLTIYRGGIFTGLAFALLMLVGIVITFRRYQNPVWEVGIIGSAFVGFCLVGLELDFPVVTLLPATMAFSVLVAFHAAAEDVVRHPPAPEPYELPSAPAEPRVSTPVEPRELVNA